MASGSRLLLLFTLATAIVVGAVVSLATGSWWFLLVAVGVHALFTTLVIMGVFKRVEQQDKPDPVTEARADAEVPSRDAAGVR